MAIEQEDSLVILFEALSARNEGSQAGLPTQNHEMSRQAGLPAQIVFCRQEALAA